MTLSDLRAAETEAILARMEAEAKHVLQLLLDSPPVDARVFFWPTRPEQIGLMAITVEDVAIRIGNPHGHTFENPLEAATLRNLQVRASIPEVEVRFIGDSTHLTSAGGGVMLAISVLERGTYRRAHLGLMDSGPPLGGLPADAFFRAFGLGPHWAHAVQVYVDAEHAKVVAEARTVVAQQRERAAHATLRRVQAKAYTTLDPDDLEDGMDAESMGVTPGGAP